MSTLRVMPSAADARPDTWLAAAAVLALGGGCTAALAAAAAGSMMAAAVAGAVAGTGLVVLIAGGWVDGLLVAALAIPLPAMVSTDELRIAAAAPVTAAVLAGWLLAVHPRVADPTARFRAVRDATLLLLAAFGLATLFASSWSTSVRELINMTLLLVFFLCALDRLRNRAAADRLITALVALAAVCGGLAVLEMTGVLPGAFPRWGTPFNRAALGFGQPNALGLFLALTAPVAVHAIGTRRGVARVAATGALIVIVAGVFATFSRGSWIALLAGALALPMAGDRRLVTRVLIGALVFGVLLDLVSGGMIRDTVQRTLTDWVVEQRAALTLVGLLMWLAHPVVGVGPGGFAVELHTFGAQVPILWDYLPTPHNAYVQMGAEAGVIGLAAYVVFLVVCFRRLVRSAIGAARACAPADEISLRRCLLWSFATLCIAGLVVWPFSHGTGQAALLLLAAGLARDDAASTEVAA